METYFAREFLESVSTCFDSSAFAGLSSSIGKLSLFQRTVYIFQLEIDRMSLLNDILYNFNANMAIFKIVKIKVF